MVSGSSCRAAVIGCVVMVVTGCRGTPHGRPATSAATATSTTTTGAEVSAGPRRIMNDDAAMRMTNARCQAESNCENAGASSGFENPDVCRRAILPQAMGVVGDEDCPAGVDESRLTRCVESLRTERCDQLGAALDTPASCQRSELCATP